MLKIEITQNCDGLCTITAPGLVVSDLTREAADAFAAVYEAQLRQGDAPIPAERP